MWGWRKSTAAQKRRKRMSTTSTKSRSPGIQDGRARVVQQAARGDERHAALDHTPEHDQHLRATRMRQGNTGVQRKHEKPYSYGPGDRAGGSHTRSDSSIEPRSAASAPEIPWIS